MLFRGPGGNPINFFAAPRHAARQPAVTLIVLCKEHREQRDRIELRAQSPLPRHSELDRAAVGHRGELSAMFCARRRPSSSPTTSRP